MRLTCLIYFKIAIIQNSRTVFANTTEKCQSHVLVEKRGSGFVPYQLVAVVLPLMPS